MVGNLVGPPVVGPIVGGLVGERLGEGAARETGLDRAAAGANRGLAAAVGQRRADKVGSYHRCSSWSRILRARGRGSSR